MTEASMTLRVAGIAGSLRQASLNRALLRAAVELAPPRLAIEIHDLKDLPIYNGDVEAAGMPAAVAALGEAVREADGVLIATPEYNHGVPGVLKNAIDWLSRPPRRSALEGKPVAVLGASPGMTGSARAQTQLRAAFVFTNSYAMPQPEVIVGRAHEKFDEQGRLTDDVTRKFVAMFLERFADWIERFRQ
ncbi:MAG TPA: NAD(P)H-dependent oxidoreductase [Vicinamibacterales bacterium]|nr:NAD(P)H-dependent oxidoreductase [Vicinamibacterales bacterium]